MNRSGSCKFDVMQHAIKELTTTVEFSNMYQPPVSNPVNENKCEPPNIIVEHNGKKYCQTQCTNDQVSKYYITFYN